jgi:hypothetical protein
MGEVSRYSTKGPKHHENRKSDRFSNAEYQNDTTIYFCDTQKEPEYITPGHAFPMPEQ